MAQFNLENEVSSAVRLDVPLTRGPLMRWQRKDVNSSLVNSSLNASASSSKTPKKSSTESSKTPSKTPGSKVKNTPGRKGARTPGGNDRFIANRATTNMDLAHYKVAGPALSTEQEREMMSPTQQEQQRMLTESLTGDLMDRKIISFQQNPPLAPAGHHGHMKVLYSTGKMGATGKKSTRYIPQVPERILDAPDIIDDYYLSLLDWSSLNTLAVALGAAVYLWSASTGNITALMELDSSTGDYITSIKWTSDGCNIAIGLSNGATELWDAMQEKKLRTMGGHAARISSLSWNSYILSSGCQTGSIHHHDVRVAQHQVGVLQGHTQEVCGLQWSPNGRYLASGGNDNVVNIWQAGANSPVTGNEPIYTFTGHQAAVKALAWCPWQHSLLASGGGTADRHIRLWNVNNGTSLNAVDTRSQVCGLLWSNEYKEIISGHGFSQNQLTIWKYPSMTKVVDLQGHTARVLHMCLSPDETTVVSAAADETLRLWNCFAVDPAKKKTKQKTLAQSESSSLRFTMR